MILLILTSHRKDCFSLSLACLEKYTNLSSFETIYFFANAVDAAHMQMMKDFKQRHDNTIILHCEPRGLYPCVVAMWNQVLEEHKSDLVVKIDEDVFVTRGWLQHMLHAYKEHAAHNALLISPLVPNNHIGREMLRSYIMRHLPEHATAMLDGPTHKNNLYGLFIWRLLLQNFKSSHAFLKHAGQELAEVRIKRYFNINCILLSPALTELLYPIKKSDENELNFILENSKYYGLMIPSCMVHHYSFSPQQNFLDQNLSLADIARFLGINPPPMLCVATPEKA